MLLTILREELMAGEKYVLPRIFLVWSAVLTFSFIAGVGCSNEEQLSDAPQSRPNTPATLSQAKKESKPSHDSTSEIPKTTSTGAHTVTFPTTHDDALQSLLNEKASEEIGRPIRVLINQRRQLAPWMFLVGTVREQNGDPVKYQTTRFATEWKEGMLDEVVMALTQQSNGGWEILAFSFGATDVPFFDWSDQFEIPLILFLDDEN